jgi:hypothetical protein
MTVVLFVIGGLAVGLGAVLTYRGFQQRGTMPGVSPMERAGAAFRVPSLVAGMLLTLVGAIAVAVAFTT